MNLPPLTPSMATTGTSSTKVKNGVCIGVGVGLIAAAVVYLVGVSGHCPGYCATSLNNIVSMDPEEREAYSDTWTYKTCKMFPACIDPPYPIDYIDPEQESLFRVQLKVIREYLRRVQDVKDESDASIAALERASRQGIARLDALPAATTFISAAEIDAIIGVLKASPGMLVPVEQATKIPPPVDDKAAAEDFLRRISVLEAKNNELMDDISADMSKTDHEIRMLRLSKNTATATPPSVDVDAAIDDLNRRIADHRAINDDLILKVEADLVEAQKSTAELERFNEVVEHDLQARLQRENTAAFITWLGTPVTHVVTQACRLGSWFTHTFLE